MDSAYKFVPSVDNLLLTGPLSSKDLTYKIVTEKARLGTEQLEKGFPVKTFVDNANEHDVWSEFKTLESVTFDRKMYAELCTDDEVKQFNRYSDILPYKKNPVTIPKDAHGENQYINASYVSSSIKGDDKSFVVCQSPLDSTIVDFWRMVIKERVHTIVMLCNFKAGNRPQSSEYFPDIVDRQFDGFKHVRLVKKTENAEMSLTIREFVVEAGSESRTVTHYQWKGWPDHGVPDKSQHSVLLQLVREIQGSRKLGNQPVIVHCSAGIGRSGTLVALHNIAQIVQAYNKAKQSGYEVDEEKTRISVFSVVRRLREERFGMVQTVAQYELIYDMTKEILQNPKLIQ